MNLKESPCKDRLPYENFFFSRDRFLHCSPRYLYYRRGSDFISSTRRKMTAKRGRAPVVTARAIVEWRFAYRKSECNIEVLSASALSRASDVTGVSGVIWCTSRRGRTGELRRRTRRLFTPARESRRRSTITVLRDRHLTLTCRFSRQSINRSSTAVVHYARYFMGEFGRAISRNNGGDRESGVDSRSPVTLTLISPRTIRLDEIGSLVARGA